MQKTKKKIIEQAIVLLNEQGFANLRLQQLAQKMSISAGNLTYHFPKKEDLVEALYEQFGVELSAITKEFRTPSDLLSIRLQLQAFYDFQQRYRFFYLDLLELNRSYPKLAIRHQEHIQSQIDGIFNTFIFNVGCAFLKQIDLDVYKQLAHQFWMTIVFWSVQVELRGKQNHANGMLQAIHQLLSPYLTEKGKILLDSKTITLKNN